jgi:dethiobiotin synthetase
MKFYTKKTFFGDILLLHKLSSLDNTYTIQKVFYCSPTSQHVASYPDGQTIICQNNDLKEFDTEEDAIQYAALEIL